MPKLKSADLGQTPKTESKEKKDLINVETLIPNTLWGLTYSVLGDNRRLFFSFLGLLLFAGISLGVFYAGLSMMDNRGFEMETTKGGIIFRAGNEESLAFLLSASDPWANTGLKVKIGDKLDIKASGKVSLAVHHLTSAAEDDEKPPHAWVDPDGKIEDAKPNLKKQDIFRKEFLLLKNGEYGALIGCIKPEGKKPEAKDTTVFLVGSSKSDFVCHQSGFLWLSVNDVLLTPEDTLAYEVPSRFCDLDKYGNLYSPPKTFFQIDSIDYWHIWFDDNIGSFMVTIKKE